MTNGNIFVVLQKSSALENLFFEPIYAGHDRNFVVELKKVGYCVFEYNSEGKYIGEI